MMNAARPHGYVHLATKYDIVGVQLQVKGCHDVDDDARVKGQKSTYSTIQPAAVPACQSQSKITSNPRIRVTLEGIPIFTRWVNFFVSAEFAHDFVANTSRRFAVSLVVDHYLAHEQASEGTYSHEVTLFKGTLETSLMDRSSRDRNGV